MLKSIPDIIPPVMSIVPDRYAFVILLGMTTPTVLLILTFALGAGTTMIRTPIIPTMSGLVSRSELPAAFTLSAVAGSIGRVVGPALGGLIVAAIAPWAVSFLNSASFVGMIIVLSRLPGKSHVHQQGSLPPIIVNRV